MTRDRQKYKIPKGINHWKKQKERYPKKGWRPFKAAAIAAATVLGCLGSQPLYAQYSTISVLKNQTNEAPGWRWSASESVNACHLRIQNKSGLTVFDDVLRNTFEFSYPDGIKHNEAYRANVQCSKDGGETWPNSWSGYSAAITIDMVPPRIEFNTFKLRQSGYPWLAYATMDDLVGVDRVHVQVARDKDFNDLVYDGEVWGNTGTSIYADGLTEGIYYARVAAIDKAGNHSTFSAPKEINSSSLYAQMETLALRTFTNQAPEWGWTKIDGFDVYKIEIQDSSGNILDSYEVENNRFSYAAGLEHGKRFQARVQGSRDGGTTWGAWTTPSVITVDTQAPEVELYAFVKQFEENIPYRKLSMVGEETTQRDPKDSDLPKYWNVNVNVQDDLSGVKAMQVQIASDMDFTNLILDEKHVDFYNSYYQFTPDETMVGDNYFVRMKVIDAAGNESEFTSPRKLDTTAPDFDYSVNAKEITNQAPEWSWPLVDGFDLYWVEVYKSSSENDEPVFEGEIGNANHYIYTGAIAHGEVYYFSVKGRKDGGLTWSEWTSPYHGTTIDLEAPEVSVDDFSYYGYYDMYSLQVNMGSDDGHSLSSMQVQLAHDPEFEQRVYDEVFDQSYFMSSYLTVDAGPLEGVVYARVKLTDKAGNESAFSAPRAIFSSSSASEISGIYANKRTRNMLEWWWTKPDAMNAFEVRVEDEEGTVIMPAKRLGNVNHFTYQPPNASDGQVFYLRVKGSTDNGVTWGDWSEKHYTRVDAIAPAVQLNKVLRDSENSLTIEYEVDEVDGGDLFKLQLQMATDAEFENVVHDKTSITDRSNKQYFIDGDFPVQDYFVRIKVIDDAGNDSGFTPAVKVTEDLPPAEDLSVFNFAAFSRYTNAQAAPSWWWAKNGGIGSYDVEVLSQGGVFVEQGRVEKRSFALGKPYQHGDSYIAKVRGISSKSGALGEWSEYSTPIMVDQEAPSVQMSSFIHPWANTVEFRYNFADDMSPLGYLKIEVATEPEFKNLVLDKMISATTNPSMYQTALAQPGDLYARVAVIDAAGNMSPYSAVAKVDTVMTSIPVMYSSASYTKNAPSWVWSDVFNTNAYQIEIQNSSGIVVHTEDLGKISRYIFSAGHEHGQSFKARVRGSIDQGANWGAWSNFSGLQTVDTEPPLLGLISFRHTDATTAELRYTADGTLSGMDYIKVQVAEDAEFNQIITTRYMGRGEIWSNYMIKDLPEGADLYVRIMGADWAGNVSEYTPAMEIDTAVAEKPKFTSGYYTHEAPVWAWGKEYLATDYEIEITDEEGNVVVNQNIGDVEQFVYTEGLVHGKTFTAKIHVSLDNENTWSEWSDSRSITVDTVKPVPEVLSVQYIQDGFVQVVFKVIEETTGIGLTQLQIATDAGFTQLVYNKSMGSVTANHVIRSNLPDLPQNAKLYARLKAVDYAGNESDYSPAVASGIAAPRIYWPAFSSIVYTSEIEVKGQTLPNAKVQLYLDTLAVGTLMSTDERGYFSTMVELAGEGEHFITTTVQNNLGVSEHSAAIKVKYQIPLPLASFIKPSNGSTIAAPMLLEVSASDILGIAKVEFYDGSVLLSSVTKAPYQHQWDVRFVDNGDHLLKAVVTNTSGKSATIERSVKVDVPPQKPVIPPTPYTGKVDGISPAISYGSQPIRISGTAVDRTTLGTMANRPLKLVLEVDGFKRTINIVTDATGAFNYSFVPQVNDKGTYQVSIIHPDEVEATPQGSFNINRVSFNIGGYKLTAARNHPKQFDVTATASGEIQGLRWVVAPEDQPTGVLPQGIVINGGNGINIAEGKSTSMNITVTADDTAPEAGTIYLRALSEDAGELIRGKLQLDYKLVQAQSELSIQKKSIQTGVVQGDSVSENIVFTNKGLVAAQNVRAQLLDEHGNPPPAWMFLANTGNIGSVNVGDEVSIQVTAQPDASIADGIYRFKLQVTADNSNTVDAYITVAITQSGIGGVRFDVADIYTATLGEDNQPILGVEGVKIQLQNEAVLTEQYEVTTGNDGTALIDELPPGIYLFRASASNHMDVSGRVRIRPGVVTDQHIFLDYQLINIEFGVTETTINDIYDIVLEATYQTQVPAPVVLLEPLSINIGGMQAGEERTGQLTLTNYGLIEAQALKFTPPQTDSEFKYEFFGDIPDTLPPKTRIVIPYRVTALSGAEIQGDEPQGRSAPTARSLMARAPRAAQCTSYTSRYWVGYEYECVNGDWVKSGNGGYYTYLRGEHCTGNGINWGSGGWGGGGGGGGWGTPGSSIPMVSSCAPDCKSSTSCRPDGESSGGSGFGGFGGIKNFSGNGNGDDNDKCK